MKRAKGKGHEAIAPDLLFLGSFVSTVVFSAAGFLDFLLLVPALISFFVWLSLTLTILRKRGVGLITSFIERRLVSGLPLNRSLHSFYVAALLGSLMLFFTLMLVGRGLHLLLAFLVWLFIGSLLMQEFGAGIEPEKNKTATH